MIEPIKVTKKSLMDLGFWDRAVALLDIDEPDRVADSKEFLIPSDQWTELGSRGDS